MKKLSLFNPITLDGYFTGSGGDISWHRVEWHNTRLVKGDLFDEIRRPLFFKFTSLQTLGNSNLLLCYESIR